MTDGAYRRLAEAVLIVHQRRADSNCLCGGLELGESWAAHVAAMLDEVGVLRDRPPDPDGDSAASAGGVTLTAAPYGSSYQEGREYARRILDGQRPPPCTTYDWCVLSEGHDLATDDPEDYSNHYGEWDTR